jgi:hypothetical protein
VQRLYCNTGFSKSIISLRIFAVPKIFLHAKLMCTVQKPKMRLDYNAYMQGRRAGKYVVIYIEDTPPDIQNTAIDEDTAPVANERTDNVIEITKGITETTDVNSTSTSFVSDGVTNTSARYNPDDNPDCNQPPETIHNAEILTITASLFSAKVLSIANRAIAKNGYKACSSRAGP